MGTDHRHARHWYRGNREHSERQGGLRVCGAAVLRSTNEGPRPAAPLQHGAAPRGRQTLTPALTSLQTRSRVQKPELVIRELCRLRHTALLSGFPFCI